MNDETFRSARAADVMAQMFSVGGDEQELKTALSLFRAYLRRIDVTETAYRMALIARAKMGVLPDVVMTILPPYKVASMVDDDG